MAIFGGGPPNLEGIKYFDLIFCHDHLLTKPNICVEFEQNRLFELYHLLPGVLMDTLLKPEELACSNLKFIFKQTFCKQ